MKTCIVGAGYAGLTTAAALADTCHTVYFTDRDSLKIDKLKKNALSYSALSKQINMVLLQAEEKINRSQLGIYMNKLNHKPGETDNIYDPMVYPPIPSVVKQLMRQNINLDGRSSLVEKTMEAYGFEFAGVGRP